MKLWIAGSVAAAAASASADHFDPFASMHGEPPARKSYAGLGRDSVSASEIAKFAPPPLDDVLARRIEAMLDVRAPGGAALISNDGDRQLYTWRVTGTNQVWRQDGPMKFPVQLTGGDERTSVVAMSPDERWVVVSRDVGGAENPGLYVLDPAGGPLRVIHHDRNVQTELAYISDDSKAVY
jgi:hypothetical protein